VTLQPEQRINYFWGAINPPEVHPLPACRGLNRYQKIKYTGSILKILVLPFWAQCYKTVGVTYLRM
jgi:hypothetical protein